MSVTVTIMWGFVIGIKYFLFDFIGCHVFVMHLK